MSLPQLLLVDDSDAVLAYEQAALSGRYITLTASNGREALKKILEVRPAVILLDLSMPEMTGDQLLQKLKADPALAHIPVIVVSAEKDRADACLKMGAAARLVKPIKADELRSTVAKVLEDSWRRDMRRGLAVITVRVGDLELALPIEPIVVVLPRLASTPMPLGPSYLSQVIQYRGEPVCVLDLAHRLGVEHHAPLLEQKLVLVSCDGACLAVCVDDVRDPEEMSSDQVLWREAIGGAEHGGLKDSLLAVLKTSRGAIPVMDVRALFSRDLLRQLPAALRPSEMQEALA